MIEGCSIEATHKETNNSPLNVRLNAFIYYRLQLQRVQKRRTSQVTEKRKRAVVQKANKSKGKLTKAEMKNKGYNTGRWSKDEHNRFMQAIEIHGKDWKKVQEYVGTRTSAQSRSHAQKVLPKEKLEEEGMTPGSSQGSSKQGNCGFQEYSEVAAESRSESKIKI